MNKRKQATTPKNTRSIKIAGDEIKERAAAEGRPAEEALTQMLTERILGTPGMKEGPKEQPVDSGVEGLLGEVRERIFERGNYLAIPADIRLWSDSWRRVADFATKHSLTLDESLAVIIEKGVAVATMELVEAAAAAQAAKS